MKLTIERDRFADALAIAMRAAGKNETIPILNNVLLRPDGQRIAIASTNMVLQIDTSVPAEANLLEGGAGIAVRADALLGIVSRLQAGAQIVLEWSERADAVTLRSGRSRYRLLALPGGDFPVFPDDDAAVAFTVPGKDLAAALKAVRFAMSKDKSRPYLHGVYLHQTTDDHAAFGGGRDAKLGLVACDGFQLARVGMPMPAGATSLQPVIVPDVAVVELIRLGEGGGDLELRVSKSRIGATAGDVVFTSKLIDATFPDYLRVLPTETGLAVTVDAAELAAALQRLRVMGDDSRLRVEISADDMKLALVSPESGDAEERVPVQCEGATGGMMLGFNAAAVLNILDAMGADVCQFRLQDPRSPILINRMMAGVVEYGRTFLTMPIGAT